MVYFSMDTQDTLSSFLHLDDQLKPSGQNDLDEEGLDLEHRNG